MRSSPKKRRLSLFYGAAIVLVLIISVVTLIRYNSFAASSVPYVAAPANTAVTTYKDDTERTGDHTTETILNTSNVNPNSFGRRVSYPVDGQIYTQPLYLPNVTVSSAKHNVVYVTTENDSVYAFDADQTSVQAPLWHANFLTNGATVPTNTQLNCNDMVPSDGLSGTPVIDASTGTLYVVAMTVEGGNFVYRLHALDVTTGLEKAGSPVVIQASVPGTGDSSVNGKIPFTPKTERQRAALTLVNGNVYIGFGSFCDDNPYHGWILGYNASTLAQIGAYNDTPNAQRGGIWAAGGAISADGNGNIYYVSGNGGFDANTGGSDYGDSYVKLTTNLKVEDYFSPFNQQCLDDEDADLGSGGALLLPNQDRLIGAGKEGRVYVMNTSNLGKYTPVTNPCANQKPTNIDKVVQELPPSTIGGLYSNASYWQSASGQQYVYFAGANDHAKAFTLNNGLLSTAPVSQGSEIFSFTGGNPTVSSNNGAAGTGIVWTLDPTPALRAYDATDLGKELYNSSVNSTRDGLGSYVKFSAPTVANGEVFVGTKSTVDIFGLLSSGGSTPTPPSSPTPTPKPNPTPVPGGYNNIGITNDNAVATGNYDGSYHSYSAEALGTDGIASGGVLTDNGFSFVWPNIAAANYDNYAAAGQTIPVTPVSNADHLGLLGSATNGSASGALTITYTDSSTQKVTVGFSDWSAKTVSFGNHIAAKMTYRNTKTGQQTIVNYLYSISIPLAAGKTLQSITLPLSVNGGQFHMFAVSTSSLTAPIYNNIGITDNGTMNPGFDSDNGNIGVGDFDGRGNTYSAQALQSAGITPSSTVSSHGFNFNWPDVASSESDDYLADGQTIAVTPVTQADHLALLGAANGGATSGTATIHYSDGSTQNFTLGFSDWTLGAGKSPISFGNTIVAQMTYRNIPGGAKQTVGVYLFAASIALQTNGGKTVTGVTLPATVSGGQIHVFSVATSSLTAPIYNNIGISNDGNITVGNFDGRQNSYSAQALQDAGLNAGDNAFDPTRTVTFTWPNVPAGTPDNYQTTGQVIPVDAASNETILAFLGSATGGASTGTATINYTDGTHQTFTLGLSDWTLGAGKVQPLASNQISYKTSYRNDPNAKKGEDLVNTYVFYTMVNITSGKTVASVTLPATVTGGQMHVFAVTAK